MSTEGLNTEASQIAAAAAFFDNFVEAFATFQGASVADLFSHPYMAVDQAGKATILDSPANTAPYFQKYLDEYKASGSQTCRYHDLEVVSIGASSALVTVTWSLHDEAGLALDSWRESYCVSSASGRMLAYASIDHA